jgi:hypothetical protein
VEVEKPFPVEVVKKLEIPVPKPYPVHMIYYKHISEDDPPPKSTKPIYGYAPSYSNKYIGDENLLKAFKNPQSHGIKSNFQHVFHPFTQTYEKENENQINYEAEEEFPSKLPKIINAYNGKVIDFPAKSFKFLKGNTKTKISDKDLFKAMKHFYANEGRLNAFQDSKVPNFQLAQSDHEDDSEDESFPPQPVIVFNGKTNKFSKLLLANSQNFDKNSANAQQLLLDLSGKFSKRQSHKFGKKTKDLRGY